MLKNQKKPNEKMIQLPKDHWTSVQVNGLLKSLAESDESAKSLLTQPVTPEQFRRIEAAFNLLSGSIGQLRNRKKGPA